MKLIFMREKKLFQLFDNTIEISSFLSSFEFHSIEKVDIFISPTFSQFQPNVFTLGSLFTDNSVKEKLGHFYLFKIVQKEQNKKLSMR